MNIKNTIIGIVIFSILFIGLGWLLVGQTPDTNQIADFTITQDDHITGNASASATLIEYSDFQCPACAGYQPFVSQLKQEMGDQIRIVFRHFPLDQIHPNARLAAQASEAAANQNAFWPMHDLLFENQLEWESLDDPTQKFSDYAQQLELDIEKFTTDLTSKETVAKVATDYQTGLKARVNSTPSFFINGNKINNPGSYETFKQIIISNL